MGKKKAVHWNRPKKVMTSEVADENTSEGQITGADETEPNLDKD